MGRAAPRRIEAIAIGASVGGVEAVSALLAALPADLDAAVFVVVHLLRDRPSLLPGLLGSVSALPVREAVDKEPIVPGHVYFAPPDYHLLIDRGPQLALSIDPPVCFCRPSIDVLFESAAQIYREALLGVVLTGNNEDGADGLAAVHAHGGRTLVQQPDTARAPTMPTAALARVPRAQVLPLQEMGPWLGDATRGGRP